MIENGIIYLAFISFLSFSIVFVEKKTQHKLFSILPSIVIIYFIVMLFSTLGLWQQTESVTNTYKSVKTNLLPAMIFLMLLLADIRKIYKLGKKMILTFFLSSISIAIGFIGMFILFHNYFEENAWKSFAALSGSWMGGTANMVAVQEALNVPDSSMGYTLLIDSINYAIWVMILLALVPFANIFNKWTRADLTIINSVGEDLKTNKINHKNPNITSILILLISATLVSIFAQELSIVMPKTEFITNTTWMVIISTIFGILFAMTPLSNLAGSDKLGNIMLYLIVALIASRANFAELTQAPLYIFAGFIIIFIHVVIMVLFAKLFKLDLFTIGVASLANIGGVASAPILASAYSKALIPIGVLMAMIGYIVGTFGGLFVGNALRIISLITN